MFFLNNFQQLLEKALQEGDGDGHYARIAQGILDKLTRYYATKISQNEFFYERMIEELSKDPIPAVPARIFSQLILILLKTQNSVIHLYLSKKPQFFSLLIKSIKQEPVYDVLYSLAIDPSAQISSFFEDINACDCLFESLSETDEIFNSRVLSIISSIISNANPDSSLISQIVTDEKISKIFDIALHSAYSESSYWAFSLIFELCSQMDDVSYGSDDICEEDMICTPVYEYAINHLEDICHFICGPLPFLSKHEKAIELLVLFLRASEENPEPFIYDTMQILLDRFFELKIHSIFHVSFYGLFSALMQNRSANILIEKLDMKHRIVTEYSKKDQIKDANYWGYLFSFTEHIIDIEGAPSEDENNEWKQFYDDVYYQYFDTIHKEFGGPLPSFFSDSDFDDDPNNIFIQISNLGDGGNEIEEEEYYEEDDF
ncbi:hypothetical protein GPJ56_007401 [Histomonas meleagridis]|uniref:uncharacterized protein n=1 Tax=Histomonas meleagridis TaxID=135588 RepID=UPI00355A5244|nr:hypothetical protein GPJ56_007401 [Histomonas meleagridis]KAH0804247.1 hypothetical protein GO595_003077 [Histomonas meleagridis]